MAQEIFPIPGSLLGYDGDSYCRHRCLDCGRERWVQIRKGKPKRVRCMSCAATRREKKKREKNGQTKANS